MESFAFYFKNVILAFRRNLLFLLFLSYLLLLLQSSLFRLSYSAARAFSVFRIQSYIYLASIFLPLFLSYTPEIFIIFRSVSLIRILKRGLVMKNRGPFYRDIDDRKCFVRLFYHAPRETTFFSLFLCLCYVLFSRSWIDVKSYERR